MTDHDAGKWDQIANDYFKYIFSPFNSAMTCGIFPRNPIVTILRGLQNVRILDVGCGPGNLLFHVPVDRWIAVTGVDQSVESIRMATETADNLGVMFNGWQGDITRLNLSTKFDVIVCVNAILPRKRSNIQKILNTVASHKLETGKCLFILPSFDTLEHLRSLYIAENMLLDAANISGRMLIEKLAYVVYDEQGNTDCQCYHTSKSIVSDFSAAGLTISHMSKVYYPWDLSNQYEYGYFPGKEEIWDWFVVAE